MELSNLTLRLLLIFLPGIITVSIINSLTSSKEKGTFIYSIEAFVYGAFSYLVLSVFMKVAFLECIFNDRITINAKEIIWASVIGVFIGLISTLLQTYEVLHRLGRALKITNKFAEQDVWSHLFNSPDITASWILFRDQSLDLAYEGWVEHFSDTVENNELFMRDVKVFCNSTGKELYCVDGLYITRDSKNITIEIRELIDSKAENTFEKGSEKNGGKKTT